MTLLKDVQNTDEAWALVLAEKYLESQGFKVDETATPVEMIWRAKCGISPYAAHVTAPVHASDENQPAVL